MCKIKLPEGMVFLQISPNTILWEAAKGNQTRHVNGDFGEEA
jgi:hypothetical protein